MSVTAIVEMEAKSGMGGKLEEALREALELTRNAEGSLGAKLYFCTENPDEIILVEHWESEAAHQRFFEFMRDSGKLSPLLDMMTTPFATTHYSPHD